MISLKTISFVPTDQGNLDLTTIYQSKIKVIHHIYPFFYFERVGYKPDKFFASISAENKNTNNTAAHKIRFIFYDIHEIKKKINPPHNFFL